MRKGIVVVILVGLLMAPISPVTSQEHHHVNFACDNNYRALYITQTNYRRHRALGMICERTLRKSKQPETADWWIKDWQILYVWCEKDDGSFARNQVVSVAWFSRRWVKAKCFTKSYWRNLGFGEAISAKAVERGIR